MYIKLVIYHAHVGLLSDRFISSWLKMNARFRILAITQKLVEEMRCIRGATHRFRVELCSEIRLCLMHNAFITSIIDVAEKSFPPIW